jgi:GAF domain-containing protein
MTLFKSPLIWRLTLWFLLLSLIPIGIVLVFVQRHVRETAIDQQLQGLNNQASLLALQISNQPDRAQEIVEEFGTDHQTAFLMDVAGTYIAHSDIGRVGSSAEREFDIEILQKLIAEQSTQIDDSINGQYIGSTHLGVNNNVAVIIADTEATIRNINNLSRDIILQLAVSLLITSLAGGTAILVVLGPVVQLSKFADRLGSGELDAEFDDSDLEGELATLAKSLNKLAVRIRASIATLEQRVNERTAELTERTSELEMVNVEVSRRASQFEALTDVVQSITSVRDLEQLLPHLATVISEKFGFYHVGIFLLDELNEYATLSAANSEGGRRMLERKHRLRVGAEGIVGHVTSTGQPRVAMDVGKDPVFFNNPDLPETHSEMALPLRSEGSIVGALDVQSREIGAFKDDDIQMLSLLANQVSLAIENARLFDETRIALAEAEAVSRQFTREAWGRLSVEQNLIGYRYSIAGTSPLNQPVDLTKSNIGASQTKQIEINQVAVPIELRGETIGTLVVQTPSAALLNQDQVDLIKAVAERVALSAENARLFEETTRRAERERLVSDITSKIRSVNDPQTMIQTAAEELRRALGATHVEVIPQAVRGAE